MITHIGRFLDLYLMLLDTVALCVLGNYLFNQLASVQKVAVRSQRQKPLFGLRPPVALAVGLLLYIFGHTFWRFLTLFNERVYTGWPYLVSTVILTLGLSLTVRTLSSMLSLQTLLITILVSLIASAVIIWATINYTSIFLSHVQ